MRRWRNIRADRFADANELRRAIFAAAQELGLEHATSAAAMPSLETFRDAGRRESVRTAGDRYRNSAEAQSSGGAVATVADDSTKSANRIHARRYDARSLA